MVEIIEKRQDGAMTKESMCVGVARVGQPDQCIISGTLAYPLSTPLFHFFEIFIVLSIGN